jgi:apolipoprotein N-acyltransferase
MAWPGAALAFVALVPWLSVLDRGVSVRRSLASGWLLAVAMQALIFRWFGDGLADYADAPPALGLIAILAFAPLLQPQLMVFAWGRGLLGRLPERLPVPLLAIASASLYVGGEWAVPKLFGDTLGHGLYGSLSMRQGAEIAGVPGLTFVLLIANEYGLAAARAFARPSGMRDRLLAVAVPASVAIGLGVLLSVYGVVRLAQFERASKLEPSETVRVAIIQADISHYGRLREELGAYDAVRRILDTHFALSHEALARGPLDLIVWPETVYPTTFGTPKSEDGADLDREIAAFVVDTGVPLIFGAFDSADSVDSGDGADASEFNAAIVLEPDAKIPGRVGFDTYHKARLFPFTERAPGFIEHTPLRALFHWVGNWQPGEGARAMDVELADGRRLRIAPLICYDAVDPALAMDAVRQGAELIVTLSNDSWFASGDGPGLHSMIAAFRSIETRRPQVRSTTTGISSVMDIDGTQRASLGVHETGILVEDVSIARGAKPAAALPARAIGPICFAASALWVGWAVKRSRP